MDEAEKYQQRVQAIAEKRRLQEEEERMKREMEEERLKLLQLKRKSLRDQWLMDSLPSAPEGPECDSRLQEPQTQDTGREQGDTPQTEGPRSAEVELKDLEDGHSETHADGDRLDTGELRGETPGGDTEHTEHWTQEAVEGPRPDIHTPMLPLKNGREARSVLGVVELQVERDLKTGATVVLSVSPVAPGQAGAPGETVFDDGRRSVQALGATGAPPGPEELGQIMDVLTGAGLQALLGDAKVITNGRREGEEPGEREQENEQGESREEVKRREADEEVGQEEPDARVEENGLEKDADAGGDITHNALQQEVMPSSSGPLERWESPQPGAGGEGGAREGAGVEEWAGPVTMTFLGFTEAEPGEEDVQQVIRAERVVIEDEGVELPPGGAENPSAPPTDTPTLERSGMTLDPAEQVPEAGAMPDPALQGEHTPTAEGGAETAVGGALEGPPPEDPTLQVTADSSQIPPGNMATTPPTAFAQEEGGAEVGGAEEGGAEVGGADEGGAEVGGPEVGRAEEGGVEVEAQAERPQDISLGRPGGVATPQWEGLGESESLPLTDGAGQQIPASTPELQPLVPLTKENPLPSRAEAGDPPKHKSCHCCSLM